jgi:hypothetical protein
MLFRRPAGLAAGLVCAAVLAAAPAAVAAPANVTIRIEGKPKTIVEEQQLRTTLQPVSKNGNPPCTGTSVAGALEQAVAGDWDGDYFSPTYFVERIRDEAYPFGATPDGWTYWVNNREPAVGMCEFELQEGDQVLFLVARCEFDGSGCANPPVLPLELRVPATGRTDASATATVVRYAKDGSAGPVEGATIAGDGVSVTTGADGTAQLRYPRAGTVRLKAEKAGFARSAAEVVTVADPGSGPPAAPGGATGPTAIADTVAPAGRILGIRDGRRFSRKRAPRTLRGTVAPDPSGLRAVKLSLTRSHRGRCQLYSPSRERFRPARCGRRVNFRIGDRQDWSYLLPSRLGPGRYVLDVVAVDKLGNRDVLARGRSRVVFFVR